MSNSFNDREKAFESKFSHDQETDFKVNARRNKLLGLWAAGKMGLSDEEAQSYAQEVVKADFEEVGHDDVVRKVLADFNAKGIEISKHLIETELQKLTAVAREQVASKQ
ncbi:DUF1476 domain-containing protein [Hwanghaeella sp.]|uniref:DUF1476 domain-containing protein n=1 Tax=Hwanghaeella sp. TaxID=2605943 RepID=UPI003CCB8A85